MANLALGVAVYIEYLDGLDTNRGLSDLGQAAQRSMAFRGRPGFVESVGGTPPRLRYKMRAQDSGAPPPGFVTWVTSGSPDFAGAGYSGGSPTPVGPVVAGSIVVADEWAT